MTEFVCYSNTLRSAMVKLEQENSALRAEAVERERELSLLREAVGHCYGIVTVPSAISLAERVVKEAIQQEEQLFRPLVGLSAETTSEQQCECRTQQGNILPPNCT